jgi:hypothetical protein
MLKNKLMLPILAVIVGVAASAFTVSNQKDSDLVWYEVNPDGSAINPSDGVQSPSSPSAFGCSTGATLCSRALSISEQEVVDNGNGTYSIAQGVDIKTDFNATARKD